MEVIGSVDQGTQSTKFTIYDRQLNVICTASAEHAQHVPKHGWSEHNPVEILSQTCDVIRRGVAEANKRVGEINLVGIGITNQRETVVVWDKHTGEPLHNAIVWHDTRTMSIVDDLVKASGADAYRGITGLPINTYFSAVKIKWLMQNIDGIAEKMNDGSAFVGTIDCWLVWNLTGGAEGGSHVTDVTNASRTFLMDINTCSWSDRLLGVFGIPRKCLPEIRSCSEPFGHLKTNELPDSLQGVVISGVAGDQQAACVGQGLFSVGQLKCTYGTGAFILVNTGEEKIASTHGLLTTPCYQLGRNEPVVWSLEGSIATAGSGITWLKDNLNMFSSPQETEALVEQTEDDDSFGVVFVPAFSGLFAPRWRQDVRGCIFGLEHGVNRGHIVRALFEAIGFQLLEIMESIVSDLKIPSIPLIRVDGGMTENAKFMQVTADIVNCTVERPPNKEVTSLGAAILAGLGCEYWKSLKEVKELVCRSSAVWEPSMPLPRRSHKFRLWKDVVSRSLNWVASVNNAERSRSTTQDLQASLNDLGRSRSTTQDLHEVAMGTANIGMKGKSDALSVTLAETADENPKPNGYGNGVSTGDSDGYGNGVSTGDSDSSEKHYYVNGSRNGVFEGTSNGHHDDDGNHYGRKEREVEEAKRVDEDDDSEGCLADREIGAGGTRHLV